MTTGAGEEPSVAERAARRRAAHTDARAAVELGPRLQRWLRRRRRPLIVLAIGAVLASLYLIAEEVTEPPSPQFSIFVGGSDSLPWKVGEPAYVALNLPPFSHPVHLGKVLVRSRDGGLVSAGKPVLWRLGPEPPLGEVGGRSLYETLPINGDQLDWDTPIGTGQRAMVVIVPLSLKAPGCHEASFDVQYRYRWRTRWLRSLMTVALRTDNAHEINNQTMCGPPLRS